MPYEDEFDTAPHICVVCGKTFNCTGDYIYKKAVYRKAGRHTSILWFCRYNHYRIWDKKIDESYQTAENIRKMGNMLKKYEKIEKPGLDVRKKISTLKENLEKETKKYNEYEEEVQDAIYKTGEQYAAFQNRERQADRNPEPQNAAVPRVRQTNDTLYRPCRRERG